MRKELEPYAKTGLGLYKRSRQLGFFAPIWVHLNKILM
jgi:hypothetical protein